MSDVISQQGLTAEPPKCSICGVSLIGISVVNGRCSPCFWARSQNADPKDWKVPNPKAVDSSNTYSPGGIEVDLEKNPALKEYIQEIKALKFDDGKLPLDLLPFEALEEITLVLQHGAKKYAAHNWRKGFIWSRPFAAILRHLFAYWKGEDLDKDSGLHHLAHAGCELLFLLSFVKTKTGVDDRYQKGAQNESNKGS